jgi:hypothetical protein
MKRNHYPLLTALLIIILILLTACAPAEEESENTPTIPEPPPAEVEKPAPKGSCGDGVCDGPETEVICPEDCKAEESVAEEPSADETSPKLGEADAPCGDGVCDEAEQADPALCPQDCDQDASAPKAVSDQPSRTGLPDYEPAINVVLILHNDPDIPIESFTFQATPRDTLRTEEGFDLLLAEAAQHDLQFTALYNGWYPMEALEMGDLSQFQEILEAGHEIGTHAHRLTYDSNQDLWTAHVEDLSFYGRPNYDPALARQTWEDAIYPLEDVLDAINASGQNESMCTRSFTFADEELLMNDYGFTIAAGDRAEISIDYFGHMVWNPFRPAADDEIGHELLEDPATSFISIDHLAQIGSHEISHDVDLTISQMQRRFLLLYTEWLNRVRTGAEDQVWTFGFVYHPNYTDRYMSDLSQFLDWLDEHFIGKKTIHGYTIARYSTVRDIAREFEDWEKTHPGTSSFNYRKGDPYPYTYPTLVTKLEQAAFESFLDLGIDAAGFQFSTEAGPIYVVWSVVGDTMLDFSGILSGNVRTTDMAGEENVQDASGIPLTEEPLVIEP